MSVNFAKIIEKLQHNLFTLFKSEATSVILLF